MVIPSSITSQRRLRTIPQEVGPAGRIKGYAGHSKRLPNAAESVITPFIGQCRGDLKIIKGFGRMMVSESELSRLVANVKEYLPRKRKR
jgi:hypothetical protein